MSEYDIHIKGGTVLDGTRVPRYRGDVWIKDGIIAQIGGKAKGSAKRVIEADGQIVAPGFVDLHTHYDAQIRWDPWCSTSCWHGVTSVVLGNCGFGFAPVKPEDRERSMLGMTRNEAVPFETMKIGMKWDWETIPEYLDSLDKLPKGVNCLHYMPTTPLVIYVMGLEAAKSRPANDEEKAEMARLLHEGMDKGLCGFSIQRMGPGSGQPDYDGTPMVTDLMVDEDILNLARVLRDREEGFIEIVQNAGALEGDPEKDLRFIEKLAEVAGRPVLYNAILPERGENETAQLEYMLAWLDSCNERGLPIFGQGGTIRIGLNLTLSDFNLYDIVPEWRELATGTHEEKMAKYADPENREIIKGVWDDPKFVASQEVLTGNFEDLVVEVVGGQAELEHYVGKSVGEIAEEEGKHPIDAMFDLSVAGNLNVDFLGAQREYCAANTASIINDSMYTFPGVSDGGAHTKFYDGGIYPTDFLTWLVRDEKLITLEEAHYRLSALPAHAAGFKDRGVLREGAPADVIVYDLDKLAITPKDHGEVVHDLPGGEWRRVRTAHGYRAIMVNGEITFEEGVCTGATPGKLLRHGRG
jgi:N-acyl-D-amino-acid deacylase